MPAHMLSPLTRFLSLAGAVTVGSLAFSSTAATGAYYQAELAGPAPEARFVARDIVWACKGANCLAGKGASRPLIMCSALAKKAGPVASFVAGGTALGAEDLARCNGGK